MDLTGSCTPAHYTDGLELVLNDEQTDMVLMLLMPSGEAERAERD